jgi:hypothetical protein
MPRNTSDVSTRQLFAKIDEDIYIEVKAKSALQRMTMREILEAALTQYLSMNPEKPSSSILSENDTYSVWDQDDYLKIQANQPVGAPIQLSETESKLIAKKAFI